MKKMPQFFKVFICANKKNYDVISLKLIAFVLAQKKFNSPFIDEKILTSKTRVILKNRVNNYKKKYS